MYELLASPPVLGAVMLLALVLAALLMVLARRKSGRPLDVIEPLGGPPDGGPEKENEEEMWIWPPSVGEGIVVEEIHGEIEGEHLEAFGFAPRAPHEDSGRKVA